MPHSYKLLCSVVGFDRPSDSQIYLTHLYFWSEFDPSRLNTFDSVLCTLFNNILTRKVRKILVDEIKILRDSVCDWVNLQANLAKMTQLHTEYQQVPFHNEINTQCLTIKHLE